MLGWVTPCLHGIRTELGLSDRCGRARSIVVVVGGKPSRSHFEENIVDITCLVKGLVQSFAICLISLLVQNLHPVIEPQIN